MDLFQVMNQIMIFWHNLCDLIVHLYLCSYANASDYPGADMVDLGYFYMDHDPVTLDTFTMANRIQGVHIYL